MTIQLDKSMAARITDNLESARIAARFLDPAISAAVVAMTTKRRDPAPLIAALEEIKHTALTQEGWDGDPLWNLYDIATTALKKYEKPAKGETLAALMAEIVEGLGILTTPEEPERPYDDFDLDYWNY